MLSMAISSFAGPYDAVVATDRGPVVPESDSEGQGAEPDVGAAAFVTRASTVTSRLTAAQEPLRPSAARRAVVGPRPIRQPVLRDVEGLYRRLIRSTFERIPVARARGRTGLAATFLTMKLPLPPDLPSPDHSGPSFKGVVADDDLDLVLLVPSLDGGSEMLVIGPGRNEINFVHLVDGRGGPR